MEWRYSSTRSLTSELDEGGWLGPRPGHFTPGIETRFPFHMWLGEASGPVWTDRKNPALASVQTPERPARSE